MKTKLERVKNDIEEMAKFNATPGCGLTRLSFTKEDRDAREYIKNEMEKAGLKVWEDAAGTVIGRLEGTVGDVPLVMVGSHFDSVRSAGNFDGVAGVVTGLEIARTIKDNNIKLKHPVEFIAMVEEEGTRFGAGLFASRAMVGKVTEEELHNFKDRDGITTAQAMKDFGFDPDNINQAKRNPKDLKAFFELHIEQGPILENYKNEIGVVEYIVGLVQLEVTITGRPDHAGTTPMNMRVDAMDAAANVISKISSFAVEEGQGTVATVGTLFLLPGASNIVPGKVTFTVDIRSKNSECIKSVQNSIMKDLENISELKGVEYSVIKKLDIAPVKLSDKIMSIINSKCEELGLSKQTMLSGAGHDAMVMAEITDVGMVFVPSKQGRSHCPEEWTEYEDLQKGIEVVYESILEIAEMM